MREILFTTESGSDVPLELQKKYGIIVLPMHVTMGNRTFDDGSVPISELYDYFDKTGDTPKSSADNVQDYIDFFTRLRKDHPDSVIYNFALAAGISTNYEHSVVAAREFRDVYTIDTGRFGAGCIAYIVEAWKLLQSKGGAEAITDYEGLFHEFDAITDRITCSFVPDSLEFLRAGGRVTNAAYIASNVLKIKPLIEPDPNGHLVATGRYRGSMIKICGKYIRDICKKYDVNRDTLYIMYTAGATKGVLDEMEKTAYELGFKAVSYDICGAVITCHGGHAAIGLGCVLNSKI
jgi:DegV family protein with EDD domain